MGRPGARGVEGLQTPLTALVPTASRRRTQSRSPFLWCSGRLSPTCRPKVSARAPRHNTVLLQRAPAPSRSGRAGLKGPTCASSCTDPDWSPRMESGWGSLYMSPELRDSSGPTVS